MQLIASAIGWRQADGETGRRGSGRIGPGNRAGDLALGPDSTRRSRKIPKKDDRDHENPRSQGSRLHLGRCAQSSIVSPPTSRTFTVSASAIKPT